MADHPDHQQMGRVSRVRDPFGQAQTLAHGDQHQRQRQDRPELDVVQVIQQDGGIGKQRDLFGQGQAEQLRQPYDGGKRLRIRLFCHA